MLVFDHVTIRAGDRVASERFYRTVLGELEIEPSQVDEIGVMWNDFWLLAADSGHPPTRHLHVAFVAATREQVDAFWRAGLDAGAQSDGEPGERPQYTPGYYGAFLVDPDGNSVEAVTHSDTRRGGHIDHLWIRVGDLDTAWGFYKTVARHTGLREGRRWDLGQQFRGAWATFSLVCDGNLRTENLHIAFAAPDRRTVREFYAAALAAGHSGGLAPTEREDHGQIVCYSASVSGPDGAIVESIAHHAI